MKPLAHFLLFALLLLPLAVGCSSSRPGPERQLSSVASPEERQAYEQGVSELDTIFARTQVSHPKHMPAMLLQGGPTEIVVVLTHGLNESPWYVKGLAKFFHERGYNVVMPLLAKHWSTVPDDMNRASHKEWVNDYVTVSMKARLLGRKVLHAGHSTGGLLAVHAAINHPKLVDGLLLWSPALALSYKTYYGSYAGWLSHGWVDLDYNNLAGKPPYHPEHVSYYSPVAGYEVYLLGLFLESEFVRNTSFFQRKYMMARASAYGSIKVPVFLVMPQEDAVVSKAETSFFHYVVSGPVEYLEYPGEVHNSVSKDEGDYYAPLQSANKKFGEMTVKLGAFLDTHFSGGKPKPGFFRSLLKEQR